MEDDIVALILAAVFVVCDVDVNNTVIETTKDYTIMAKLIYVGPGFVFATHILYV